MKFLLVAVNAKYIHSNLGVYSLKAYGDRWLERLGRGKEDFLPSDVWDMEIEIGEYTINHPMDQVMRDIYQRRPSVLGISCYIWNISYVKELVRNLKKVLPQVDIWLGGPEVSYDAVRILENEPSVDGIMMGEGEETFAQLVEYYTASVDLMDIAGLAYRGVKGEIQVNPARSIMDLSKIPFSYGKLDGFEHRIIYYESSRGCPYACSYCLSSIDKSVRFRNLELVKQELQFFLERKVPQVKFVDRTFNCKKDHAIAIWQYLLDHDNGITNFHFEISADLLGEEELALIQAMRPGLIQLEIGVQTTNPDTIREIRRKMDLEKLRHVVKQIKGFGNVHQHLDLIVGLPFEDYASFVNSFNDVYSMKPDQLQLGFLKVLKGSYMEEAADAYELVCKGEPPYEVLKTTWLDYDEILRLKAVEEMVEVYYNSGQFGTSMALLEGEFPSAFAMFEALSVEYEQKHLVGVSHNRLARYEILYEFIEGLGTGRLEEYRDCLMYDLYLRENVKSRPAFARDQSGYKLKIRDFFIAEGADPNYLKGYESYDSRQMSKMAHVEAMGDGCLVLFDYQNRDPLSHNAKTATIGVM